MSAPLMKRQRQTKQLPQVDPSRLVALEARQADLERRIAELERRAAEQVPWPINPYPQYPVVPQPTPWMDNEPYCPVCCVPYKNMSHYVCNHPRCPSRVTCVPGTSVGDPPESLRPYTTCQGDAQGIQCDQGHHPSPSSHA